MFMQDKIPIVVDKINHKNKFFYPDFVRILLVYAHEKILSRYYAVHFFADGRNGTAAAGASLSACYARSLF